ncbi:MAG: rod shape-determining protein RodA [Clostridia bacterium]|nr:rod shape-determining protein RodA [Clostridia bacterium]
MRSIFRNADYILIGLAVLLVGFGIIGIYSAGFNSSDTTEYIKQLIWFGIGAVIMLLTWLIDYNVLGKLSYVGYGVFLVLLVAVLFTTPVNNATSWFDLGFFTFQPSELMKIVYILMLAKILDKTTFKDKKSINKLKNLGIILAVFLVPFLLILKQPDFGTAIVFAFITFFMLYKAGISYKYIIIAFLVILALIPLVYMFVLSDYQQNRIKVFLNPELDPLDSGYNAIQSKIAIGSGKLTGTGLLQGTQTQFGYLPVKSSDFIFSAIAEELGFIVCVIIILVYVIMIFRMINISNTAKDRFGSIVSIGIASMFMFHLIENVGMTMGLLPITGIPLLFVSYGGSSMLTSFIALGIMLSISSRRQRSYILN